MNVKVKVKCGAWHLRGNLERNCWSSVEIDLIWIDGNGNKTLDTLVQKLFRLRRESVLVFTNKYEASVFLDDDI